MKHRLIRERASARERAKENERLQRVCKREKENDFADRDIMVVIGV